MAAGHTAVGLLWTGEHGEPEEKTPRYKSVSWMLDASVCSLGVCVFVHMWLSTSVPIPLRVSHFVCVCVCLCMCVSVAVACVFMCLATVDVRLMYYA